MIKCYLRKGKFTIRTVYHKLFEILNDDTCTGDIECCNIILPNQSAYVQGIWWCVDLIIDHQCKLISMTTRNWYPVNTNTIISIIGIMFPNISNLRVSKHQVTHWSIFTDFKMKSYSRHCSNSEIKQCSKEIYIIFF